MYKYNCKYDNPDIRNPKYSVSNYIEKYYKPDYECLDLGCGNARKIIALASLVKTYYAVDYDKDRISSAKKLLDSKCTNIVLGVADNLYLPFENERFDLVSAFMTRYSLIEIDRVLKPDGILIIEDAGADDKRHLKMKFGRDSFGWRGWMLSDNSKDRISRFRKSLVPFFETIELKPILFSTTIKAQSLIDLFEMTDCIRDFNRIKDGEVVLELQDDNKNVSFTEERIIFVGKKRKQ